MMLASEMFEFKRTIFSQRLSMLLLLTASDANDCQTIPLFSTALPLSSSDQVSDVQNKSSSNSSNGWDSHSAGSLAASWLPSASSVEVPLSTASSNSWVAARAASAAAVSPSFFNQLGLARQCLLLVVSCPLLAQKGWGHALTCLFCFAFGPDTCLPLVLAHVLGITTSSKFIPVWCPSLLALSFFAMVV